jgi:thiol:disulfide interchange protein DsbC
VIKKAFFGIALIPLLNLMPAAADTAGDEAVIRKALSANGVKLTSVKPSAVPGLYEVIAGALVVYVSADGRYLLQGDLFDTKTEQSLTDPSRRTAVKSAIDAMGEKNMIVFSPKHKEHTLTVFTDIDCPYCRKLHSEIGTYLDKGIEVRYMMFPRAGKNSDSYRKAVAVWCSDDRNEALTLSKAGKAIPMKTCDNPIDRHMELANELGLKGTPLLVLDDGTIQPGYVPAEALAQYYDAHRAAQ